PGLAGRTVLYPAGRPARRAARGVIEAGARTATVLWLLRPQSASTITRPLTPFSPGGPATKRPVPPEPTKPARPPPGLSPLWLPIGAIPAPAAPGCSMMPNAGADTVPLPPPPPIVGTAVVVIPPLPPS